MTDDLTILVEVRGLRVAATPRPSGFDRWFDVAVTVDAPPFSGTMESILVDHDLAQLADGLDAIPEGGGPGVMHEVMLGGGRAAELVLTFGPSTDRRAPLYAASVTPSGDDPNPYLRFLLLHDLVALDEVAATCRALAALDPWPTAEWG